MHPTIASFSGRGDKKTTRRTLDRKTDKRRKRGWGRGEVGAGGRPLSFSDSSLVGLRPFLLPLCRRAASFLISLALRYWLTLLLHLPLFHLVSHLPFLREDLASAINGLSAPSHSLVPNGTHITLTCNHRWTGR